MASFNQLVLRALNGIRNELRGLRGEQKKTNARLDETNARLDETNARLDETNARLDETISRLGRLEERTTRGFLETNTHLAALSQQVTKLAERVAEHDRRLDHMLTTGMGAEVRALREKVDRLWEKVFAPRRPARRARRRRPALR